MDAKEEVRLMLTEIRSRITKAQTKPDESLNFLRNVDHEVDADIMAGQYKSEVFIVFPNTIAVASKNKQLDFLGCYEFASDNPPMYQNRSKYQFVFDADQGYWTVLSPANEVLARCADTVHKIPDKLGGHARPFEVANRLKIGVYWTFDFSITVDKVSFYLCSFLYEQVAPYARTVRNLPD